MKVSPDKIRAVMDTASQLISYDEIMQALDEMAEAMHKELEHTDPVFLTVMNGGLMTTSELAKRLNFPMNMDYVHASRYRGNLTGGAIHWKREPGTDLEGRVVVIVDDILDGGITLAEIIAYCDKAGAKKIYSAVLIDKQINREESGVKEADFTGLYVDDHYVFGFGLDYHDYLRNIPGIYAVAKEHMD